MSKVVKAGIYTDQNDIVSDCIWALSYLTDSTNDQIIDYMVDMEMGARLIQLL